MPSTTEQRTEVPKPLHESVQLAPDIHQSSQSLPKQPLVVIEPSGFWVPLDLRDSWSHRDLLYFLIWRDLKVRYKQTVLGVMWVVLQPLLTTVVFTIFLGRLARVPSDGLPYPLFVYAGLLPWTFFSYAIGGSSNSIVGNANLITKVYFPRILIPLAAVGGRLIDLAISLAILAGLLAYYRVAPGPEIIAMPVFLTVIALLALGLGMWVSALNVKYRDVGIILPVAIQLWMFASPIVYPASLVPDQWQWLYRLNPLVGLIQNFRASVFGGPFDWPALLTSLLATVVVLVYSAYAFRRMEKSFADVV